MVNFPMLHYTRIKMNIEMDTIRCTIMRAGTSKGIFLLENELATYGENRNDAIRAIFGSPDIRQIDGLGGADVLTSKLAIIGPPTRADADVDYTFAQVSFVDSTVDYKGNCGNISAGVGPFAIDMGLIAAKEPFTVIKIHMTNSGRLLTAQVPVKNGKAQVEGDLKIDGVPGTGAPIIMDWSNAVGGITGKLLPTGNTKDIIEVDGKEYPVSIVDAGNPLVFINAKHLGLNGTESPTEIEENRDLMVLIEKIRGKGAVLCGLISQFEDSVAKSPYNPFFAIVSESASYMDIGGNQVRSEDIHMTARLLFMQKMHKTYPITGTVCTGAAGKLSGTVVWEVLSREGKETATLKIGHPAGIVPVDVIMEAIEAENAVTTAKSLEQGTQRFRQIGVYRTARMLMDGHVYIRKSLITQK